MSPESTAKFDAARQRLRHAGSVVVAFSGGIDSAVASLLAVQAVGPERSLAITGRSHATPSAELESVAEIAAEIGIRHELLDTDEFANPDYLRNPTDRCYYCKNELYGRLTAIAAERRLGVVINGLNADDLSDYRPGIEAAKQHGIVAPLADAAISKAEIRAFAAAHGLSIHDKPASPCLSSRVPYGEAITPDKLRRIDAAERLLRELGFRECRVRHHDRLARIEVPADEIERLARDEIRERLDAELRAMGFLYVTLDLRGLRSGSLNEALIGRGLATALAQRGD